MMSLPDANDDDTADPSPNVALSSMDPTSTSPPPQPILPVPMSLPDANDDDTADPSPIVALSSMDPTSTSPPPPPILSHRRRRTATAPLIACRRSPRLYSRTISNLIQVPKTDWSHYDITHEILSRLSTKSLARFNCVCKDWQRTISSPFFLKTQIHKRGLKSTTGFIVQDELYTRYYIPVGDINVNVQPLLFKSLPRDDFIIASCNGLICYRSNTSPESESAICVSNLVNKHLIKLPSLEITDSEVSIALACVESFAKFKLVRIVQKTSGGVQLGFEFQLYSSETGEWRVPNNSSCIAAPFVVVNSNGVCVGDVLYWLTYDKQRFTYDKKVLVFDIDKGLARLIRGPIKRFGNMSYHMIGLSEGSLHYVLATKDLGVVVWCLESSSDVKWTQKYGNSFEFIYGQCRHCIPDWKDRWRWNLDNETLIPLGFKDSVLLLKLCKDVIAYDFRNDKMAHSCAFKDLNLPCFYPSPSTRVFPFHVLG